MLVEAVQGALLPRCEEGRSRASELSVSSLVLERLAWHGRHMAH